MRATLRHREMLDDPLFHDLGRQMVAEPRLDLPLQIAVAAWLFAFGAAVGSFVNVVAFRLPRGKSLIYPGSACPQCGRAIRWHDNIPILGWLRLGGCCRDCQEPISVRYPLVEAATACIFVLVAWPDFCQRDVAWLVPVRHLLLMSVLVSAALMELDGERPPLRMLVAAALLGVLIPARSLDSGNGLTTALAHAMKTWHEQLLNLGVASAIGALGLPLFGRAAQSKLSGATAICELGVVGALTNWNLAALAGAIAAPLVALRRAGTAAGGPDGRAASSMLWARPLCPVVLALLVVRPQLAAYSPSLWDPKRPEALFGAAAIGLASLALWLFERRSGGSTN